MSTAIADIHEVPAESRVNYLNATYGVKSWLLTLDHKRIALLYLGTITLMFVVGGMAAVLMRLNLIEPQGALVEPETYNKLFSIHGIIMVFFFLVPSIPATLGNFLIPLMIGARDVAFPKLNLMSWYIFVTGAACVMYAVMTGGVDTGWTFYTPYSSSYSHTHVIAAALGIFIAGFSSILTGLNFLVTIHKMRAPGMTWFRLPLFHLGDVRNEPHFRAGNAGDRGDAVPAWEPSGCCTWASSIRRSAAIRCCSSTCSGSIRIPPCTS